VHRRPGTSYLALHILACHGLPISDENGSSDPFVTATWDECSQQTRVVRNTRSPRFDETLYFPVKLVRITKEDMEKKGDITVYVLDYDPTGADNLGFIKISLDQITNAPYKRMGDGKSRVFEVEEMPLQQPGSHKSVGIMHLQ
jgi:Ca2+-dependent lipid-binding protein